MSHCRQFALSTGYLMRVPSDEIRKQVCDTVITFYCEGPSKQVQRKFSICYQRMCLSRTLQVNVTDDLLIFMASHPQ